MSSISSFFYASPHASAAPETESLHLTVFSTLLLDCTTATDALSQFYSLVVAAFWEEDIGVHTFTGSVLNPFTLSVVR